MALKRILTTVLAAVIVSGSTVAQNSAVGDVSVVSDPPGAVATLEGEATVSGVTPARFHYALVGDYRLVVRMEGYETYSTHVYLEPTRPMEFIVTLSQRTPFKAALRSMAIPGWGQFYTGQKTKGVAMAFLTVGSVAAFLIADNRFDDKYDLYQEKLREYDAATSYDDLERLHPGLVAAQNDARDAEDVRRITIGVVAGVWAFNVIDNFLFFPHRPGGFRVKGLTVAPEAGFDQVGLSVGMKF